MRKKFSQVMNFQFSDEDLLFFDTSGCEQRKRERWRGGGRDWKGTFNIEPVRSFVRSVVLEETISFAIALPIVLL